MFEELHNGTYCNVSYVKSEKSDIWRTGASFQKPFGETVEEKHIYDLVKPNSIVKNQNKGACYQVFLESGKIDLRAKFKTLRERFKPKLIFSLNLH